MTAETTREPSQEQPRGRPQPPAARAGERWMARLRAALTSGLLAERDFRLMWLSSSVTAFGAQITTLALPLTAVLLLDATPRQMELLVALETVPYSIFSLHAGLLIDRRRKLPIMLVCEAVIGMALLCIPVAALLGVVSMPLLYVVGFVLGTVFVFVGSAAQDYLTQIAGRDRLIGANGLFGLRTTFAAMGLLVRHGGAARVEDGPAAPAGRFVARRRDCAHRPEALLRTRSRSLPTDATRGRRSALATSGSARKMP